MSKLQTSNGTLVGARRELHTRFAAERGSARAARRELHTLVRHLDHSELQIAELLTSELVSNSVQHSGTAPNGVVELDVALDPHMLRVEVRDDGPGFDPQRGPFPADREWGLQLLDELSDRWGVSPGTTVWFELDR